MKDKYSDEYVLGMGLLCAAVWLLVGCILVIGDSNKVDSKNESKNEAKASTKVEPAQRVERKTGDLNE